MNNKSCVLLFSGGTDSLCSAALLAEKYSEIHLITYFELATSSSSVPTENVKKLQLIFPDVKFKHFLVSTNKLIKKLSYDNYFKNLLKFGFYNLSTPGLSSLSWHLHTIKHCREYNINVAFDGMTQELVHLPGHNPAVRALFTELYLEHKIEFSSPVISWAVPPDQRYVDRLIVDRHGFTASNELIKEKTTGTYVYEKGLLPHPNIKGSLFDQKMQHDCYPFVVFNIFVFWWAYTVHGEKKHNELLVDYMKYKVELGEHLLKNDLFFESEVELC